MSAGKSIEARRSRILRTVLGAGILTATFSGAILGGVLLHASVAPSRRLAAAGLTHLLTNTFTGRVVIESIEHIDAMGFEGAKASVYDPAGVRVLSVSGLRGRSSLVDLVARIVRGVDDLEIFVPRARVEYVEVNYLPDEEGIPSLARAFTPRPSPTTAPGTAPPPRVRVWLPSVEMGAARVRGRLGGLENVDVELGNVTGSVLAGTERTSIRLTRFSLSASGLAPLRAQGTAETRIELPSSTGQDVSVWSTFDGHLGDVQVNMRVALDGTELEFFADAVKAKPEAVRGLFPAWPIHDDTSLHLRARGKPPNLVAEGSARIGPGVAEFAGDLKLAGGVQTNLAVEARDIDLRSFVPAAPATSIDASGAAKLSIRGKLEGTIEANSETFRIGDFDVPPAAIEATIDDARVSGNVVVRDPALTSRIDFDVHPGPNDGPVVAELAWSARAPAIDRIPWLSPIGSGEARWWARGEVTGGRLQARVDGTVSHFVRPSLALEEGQFRGTLRGSLEDLRLSASLEGRGFQLGPLQFPELSATAEGPFHALTVSAAVSGPNAPKLRARALVDQTESGTALREVEVTAARDDVVLSGKVGGVDITGDRIALREIAVRGMGDPLTGSVTVSPSLLRVRLGSNDIDLKKLGAVLLPGAGLEGRLTFDVDAELDGRSDRGHARARLENAGFSGFAGVEAVFEADVRDDHFSGGAGVTWGDLGSLSLTTTDAHLSGSVWKASTWTEAVGQLQIDTTLDLERVTRRFGPWLGSVPQAAGDLRAKVLLSRREPTETTASNRDGVPPPDVDLLLWTSGLRIGKKGEASSDASSAGFESEGVDAQLALHVEGAKHESQLAARLVDGEGLFAGLTASADVRLEELWAKRNDLANELLQLPVTAQLTLPRRGAAAYPTWARIWGWRGDLEASALFTGAIRSPSIDVTARGYGLEALHAGLAVPVEVEVRGRYNGERAVARLLASRPEGVVLHVHTDVNAPIERFLSPERRPDEKWWDASGGARLFRFPLASLPLLSQSQLNGVASGSLSFRGMNRDPEVEAELECKDIKIDTASFPRAVAILRVAKERIVASTKLEQPDGGASATASARLKWTSPVTAAVDRSEPVDLFVEARELRALVLQPLLFQGIFSQFDGRLNGTLHLHQEGDGDKVAETVAGTFELRDGTLQVPEIGQQFRNASAHIEVNERGEVQVKNVSANGVSGRVTASGKVLLKGFSFVGAEGDVRIAKKEAVPLTVEGVSLGDAWGTLLLHAKMADDHTVKLDVDVPVFHADLPESSARDVQALGDHPDIDIGLRLASGTFSELPLGPARAKREADALGWHITFYLGQEVVIRRGSMLELVVGGEPVVDLTDEVRVSGEIDLRSGKAEVFGKRFEIVHGSAKFEGDEPGNPNVAVSARWDAPDGTRVFADFVGPLRTGRLSLRSEPARPQSDILAIMLFGSSDVRTARPGPSLQSQGRQTANAGAVLAGGAVTTSVNKVLSSVTPLDITTRVTSDAYSPKPEVAIRISPKVTAQISYRARAPRPTERQDRVLVTLDWRFRRNWSIATTVGDRGSSVLDLIWNYRY